jgi:hypothetical protein
MSARHCVVFCGVRCPILGRGFSSFYHPGGSKFIRLQLLRALQAAARRGLRFQAYAKSFQWSVATTLNVHVQRKQHECCQHY